MTCPRYQGEVIVGSDGRWLGGFDEIYHPSPFPVDLGDPIWPVGFTPVGWGFGTFAGHNSVVPYTQWRHGTVVYCPDDSSAPPGNHYDLESSGVWSQNVIAPNTHVTGAATDEPALWPIANFYDWIYSSADMRVVVDNSGPTGIEDANALEVDFSGLGNNEGFTFVGEGGGFLGAGPIDPNYGDETDRSTTGWNVALSSCWTLDFWIKPVPDDDGFTCTGFEIGGRWGFYPEFAFFAGQTLVAGWQHYQQDSSWFDGVFAGYPMANAAVGIGGGPGNISACPAPHGIYSLAQKRGRVHVKCLHVYPCGSLPTGVHVNHSISIVQE